MLQCCCILIIVFAWLPMNQGKNLNLAKLGETSTIVPLTASNQRMMKSRKMKNSFKSRKAFRNFYDLLKITYIGDVQTKTKNRYTTKVVTEIAICYDRFKRCASELSPAFCGGYDHYVSFYIWARRWADHILHKSDGHSNVKCSEDLLKIFARTFYRRNSNKQ